MAEAWHGSRGHARDWKPRGWAKTRARIMRAAGGRCQYLDDGVRCAHVGAELDHVIPIAEGGSDEDANLAWLCVEHHKAKSLDEAQRGQQRRRARARLPTAPHPGLR